MNGIEIAHHRFGYGPRANAPLGGDPRQLLRAQLDNFDPMPTPLKSFSSSARAVEEYFEHRRKLGQLRGMQDAEEKTRLARRARGDVRAQQVAARAEVAARSDTPFAERLVHFWTNHFAVSAANNKVRDLTASHEFERIRPRIMGSFADLLESAALTPAMLVYLDQFNAFGPASVAMQRRVARGRAKGGSQVNENLAREILELHTLGVNGGYDQADIIELAKALTGWSIKTNSNPRGAQLFGDGSAFFAVRHEPGARQVMGRRYSADGADQARRILRDLATHPATAKHIATKLARHFTADMPAPSLIAILEQAFLTSGGDLPTVYQALIGARESWVSRPRKFRTPWEWLIAIHRGTGATIPARRQFTNLLRDFGQPAWEPPSPAGFDDIASAWAGPDALMRRVNAANAYSNRAGNMDARALAQQWFPHSLSNATSTAIARAESPQQGIALLLVSPEMMRR